MAGLFDSRQLTETGIFKCIVNRSKRKYQTLYFADDVDHNRTTVYVPDGVKLKDRPDGFHMYNNAYYARDLARNADLKKLHDSCSVMLSLSRTNGKAKWELRQGLDESKDVNLRYCGFVFLFKTSGDQVNE